MATTANVPLTFESLSKLQVLVDEYRSIKAQYDSQLEELIVSLDDQAEGYQKSVETLIKESANISDVLATYDGKVRSFHRQLEGQASRESLVPTNLDGSFRSSQSVQLKVEKIKIPTFNGNILEFNNFKGLFVNLVHNNPELSNVQKLHYLKQSFIDDAKDFIRDFELLDESYAQAWSRVLDKYDNKLLLVESLFRKLTDIEAIKNDSKIGSILDQTDIVIRGLKAAGETITETFSRYVTFLLWSKLDHHTAKEFRNSLNNKDMYPHYEQIRKFLQVRAYVTPTEASSSSKSSSSKPTKTSFVSSKTSITCQFCLKSHRLVECKEFIGANQPKRFECVKTNRLCIKCLRQGHSVKECRNEKGCGTCAGNHHSLLHRNSSGTSSDKATGSTASTPTSSQSSSSGSRESQKSLMSITSHAAPGTKSIVLATAVSWLKITSKNGTRMIKARLLLDNGSQATLISEDFIRKNNIITHRAPNPIILGGITGNSISSNFIVNCVVMSRYNVFELDIVADVVSKIPYCVESVPIVNTIRSNRDLAFAEHKLPYSSVDIIIGAEYYESCVLNQSRTCNGVFLRESQFGWLISGPYASKSSNENSFCGLTILDIQSQLKKFWEIEEVDVTEAHDEESEHQKCAQFVESTLYRDETGRFVARLPLKLDRRELGESKLKASQMLKRNERKYDEPTRQLYAQFIQEYIDLGHMTKIEYNSSCNRYFIPHHAVLKPESTSTKLRPVFNASSPSSTGVALNDILMVGPTIQPDQIIIILRFRDHNVAFSCDIAKMYRSVQVHIDDRDLQCILWRFHPNDTIDEYWLTTLTNGTGSASFIATKCLDVLGDSCEHPEASQSIKEEFVMDDWLSGAESVEKALELQTVVHSTLASAHFNLRKYKSNSSEFLSQIEPELIENTHTLKFGDKKVVSLVGLYWEPKNDLLSIKLHLSDDRTFLKSLTKRAILSNIARIYDPLGIIAPVTIRAKLILQEVWKENLQWDDIVSQIIMDSFESYYNDLDKLVGVSIRRQYSGFTHSDQVQLIGFCDASERAYSAVIYYRSIDPNGNVDCYFVIAKTKVAPRNEFKLTIPKLELQAAELLSRLMVKVASALKITEIFAFTDSTTVLAWLNGDINRWTLFVQNRVRKIVAIVPCEKWSYVKTKENPADLGTRGIEARKFVSNDLWFRGPKFLCNRELEFESFDNSSLVPTEVPEQRSVHRSCNLSIVKSDISLIHKYSSYVKLVNVMSYIMKFIRICKLKHDNVEFGTNVMLTLEDKGNAIDCIIRLSQTYFYDREIGLLKNDKCVMKSSPLRNLLPFLDKFGIVRSRSRISNSNLPYDTCNPIILSAKCKLVELIIDNVHVTYYHATRSFIKTFIVSRYHVCGGLTNVIKKCLRKCTTCIRYDYRTLNPLMGQIPTDRVTISRPFSKVGVDLAGPFKRKCLGHRSIKFNNLYIAVFVCFVTRAIHIEMVPDLSSKSFIDCLQRFVARRGIPSDIFSDNATNFIGVNNWFQIQSTELQQYAFRKSIVWHFIPPRTPHFGGIWEAAVKSAKRHLLRILNGQVLDIDQYHTIFVNIECILNSRPLCYRTGNDEPTIITPGHFLIGDSLLNLPVPESSMNISLFRRLELVQTRIKSFWRNWSNEYLNSLKARTKWVSSAPNIQVGDVVIMKIEHEQPSDWPIGIITESFPGSDGIIRVVTVKSRNKLYKRSVNLLIPLSCDPCDNEAPLPPGGVC